MTILVLWFFLFGAIVYFIPTIVAFARHHPQAVPVTIVNVLLGWTLLGWVGSLVWALISPVSWAAAAGPTRRCPFCAEFIQAAAVVCRHCGRPVEAAAPRGPWPPIPAARASAPLASGAQTPTSADTSAECPVCRDTIPSGRMFCPSCGTRRG